MKPVQKLIIAEIMAALALVAALVLGQTATFTVPTTLPAGSTVGVTVTQTPAAVVALPVTSPPPVTPPPTANSTAGPTTMPGPTNTGPVAGTALTPYTGPQKITVAGTVIENASITAELEIDAANVTIQNCAFNLPEIAQGQPGYNDAAVWIDAGADNCIVENSSFTGGGPGTVQIMSSANNLKCLNLHIYDTPTDPFQFGGSATVSGCWLERIGWNAAGNPKSNATAHPTFNGNDHVNDIFFGPSGPFLNVTNNNFDTRGNSQAINGVAFSLSSFCIFADPYNGGVLGPVTISNNYLDGGGYVLSLCGQGPYTITNNIMGLDQGYPPGYLAGTYVGGPWTWSGNTTSEAVPQLGLSAGGTIPIPGVDSGQPVGQP
jgi:hypothetical protein